MGDQLNLKCIFFRWVSEGEFRDLQEVGYLRTKPVGGFDHGKLVTDTAEDAIRFGKDFDEFPDGGTVLELRVMASDARNFVDPFNEAVDGGVKAWLLPNRILERVVVKEWAI